MQKPVKWVLVDVGAAAKRPAYVTIDEWIGVSAMSRREVYRAINRGDLKAIKRGTRTLIDVDAGLAWLQSLPPAKIRADKRQANEMEVT
jgi:hypothetical protein